MVPWLAGLTSFYVKDLRALPEDKLTTTFGGCTKTPLAITAEVIGLCRYATACLQGNPPTGDEAGMGPDVSGLDSMDKLVGAVEQASADLSAAIQGAPAEIWSREIIPPWQMPTTVFGIANIAINHIWYHDGQINTYQCLLGDDKMHWMD